MKTPASLYFHVPFCTRKCDYCHFYVIPDKEIWKVQYMEGLRLEWMQNRDKLQGKELLSIYFGGGTPFLLGPKRIGSILSWIKETCLLSPTIEITLEANPENITEQLMQDYAAVGINRVSIGIQTLDDTLLNTLTRQHNAKKAIEAVKLTSQAGIKNISIDLMYDLPGQDLKAWERTLEQAVELPITHLSLYNLTLEPHTVFFKKREKLLKSIPNEEASLQMYEMAIDKLAAADLKQYEISAFAKSDCYSRHNYGYWTGRSFLGLGPSAFSYWKEKRYQNCANLSYYCKSLAEGLSAVDYEEELDPQAKVRELFTVQLRLCSGLNLSQFTLENETQETLQRLATEGFVSFDKEEKGETIVSLTKRGILFYDSVAADLI